MESTARHPRPTARRRTAALVLAAAATLATACGSSSSTTLTGAATTTAIVKPPPLMLQGCNYVINSTVPAGMSSGIQPPFPPVAAGPSAVTALTHIQRHGGTALITGFTIPAGTKLYAGPDTSADLVATIGQGGSLLVAEPVLWSSGSGQQWIATFLACGGPNLYWIQVAQIGKADPSAGAEVTGLIAEALAAPPSSPGVSVHGIVIDAKRHFAWTSGAPSFAIGRGIYQGF